ncbi:MAG TPA: inositol monophosphatase family protein [Longimicrobiales bacterium]|nr:inositol monophosphatase family protein [Longimicrobiales bacterium]
MSHRAPLLRTALDAAEAAAVVLHRWSGRVGMDRADAKGFGDFVSKADLEAQDAALSLIRDRHPDHRILAEEGDPDPAEAAGGPGFVWVVDPLDGTKNFLHGHPVWAVSVAVAREGRAQAGAVLAPVTAERWWATRGGGAWKNGRPIRVSDTGRLGDALVGTGFPFKRLDLLPAYVEQFQAMVEAGAAVRRGGAAAVDLCYLAEGRFDAFWELILNPWDFAAGALIVEEAGGVLGRPGGGPLTLTPGGLTGANSPALLRELEATLRGAES